MLTDKSNGLLNNSFDSLLLLNPLILTTGDWLSMMKYPYYAEDSLPALSVAVISNLYLPLAKAFRLM